MRNSPLSRESWLAAAALALGMACQTRAQAIPPFFSGDAVGFEAQISTVDSGPSMAVHATVSADRKYVTLGSQTSDNTLLSLATFRLAGPNVGGFVGMASPMTTPTGQTTGQTVARTSILDQRGMTLVAAIAP